MKTPVLLTFDMDAEALWAARDPRGGRVWVSQGHYGPKVGLPRILALLEQYDIDATFFVPGIIVERYPSEVESILDHGHPIEHHSYTHKWSDALGEAEEREEFQKGWDAIVAATGRKPQGWRSPAGELTPFSIPLMQEYGFEYSSNLFDADRVHLLDDDHGTPTDIVEIPFAWAGDDAPFFMYSNRLPGRVMQAPSAVAETWKLEYDGVSQEEGSHFILGMHPQVIGRPSHLWALEQTILHIVESGQGEFLNCPDYVARMKPALLAERESAQNA